jgi:hypothetical protein
VGWNCVTYRCGLQWNHCLSTTAKSCNTRRKPYPSAILCTTNQTCTTLGMKPSLRAHKNGEKSLELKHSQLCYYMKLQSNITIFFRKWLMPNITLIQNTQQSMYNYFIWTFVYMVNKRSPFLLVIAEQYQLSMCISSVLSRFNQDARRPDFKIYVKEYF